MPDLSVVIPARNERWLSRTVEDVCANMRGDTEVIVILDGAWPEPGYELKQHPNVQVVHHHEPIGQRAATNLGAKISTAKYVMKLDAHTAVAPAFDVELMNAAKELGPDCTQIPAQHNLHVFDWVCGGCKARIYQGPTPATCGCGGTFAREIVWNAKRRRTEFWRFDSELHFQYWGAYKSRPEAQGEICDVMTSLGACFFMERERFWQLGGLDTDHGSWGQLGVEVALKSALSGGRHVVNRRTWFSHMFRTQGGDFGFPYAIHGHEQDYARQYSRNLWRGGHWPLAVKPLRWVVEKFWPVPGWTQEQLDALPTRLTSYDRAAVASSRRSDRSEPERQRVPPSGSATVEGPSRTTAVDCGVVYYSDCRGDEAILEASRRSIERSGLTIVAVTLKPIAWDTATKIVLPLERSYLTMFRQILAGLEASTAEYVFFAEHDVIYDESHWTFTPPKPDVYYYNLSWWKVDAETGRAVTYVSKQTSQLCANRELLIEHYRKRVERVEREGFTRAIGFEPGSHGRKERIDDVPSDVWRSSAPNLDIRHRHNLTPSRWSRDAFRSQRNCEGWQETVIDVESGLRRLTTEELLGA